MSSAVETLILDAVINWERCVKVKIFDCKIQNDSLYFLSSSIKKKNAMLLSTNTYNARVA